ncbi:radical SAM protein [Acidobacteria bacterium ACD]|nr:MAG: radical SAM protein [Acidobacteriota bacterium]MDL1949400.1 radical SAM protein [Acidobacteria bacterium ACD]
MPPRPAPAYRALLEGGELRRRAGLARARLGDCTLCPRACHADRTAGPSAGCRTGALARVASYGPHHGEEAPLRGRLGSGTVFFSGCSLRCVFCQNFTTSQLLEGPELTDEELARVFLDVAASGCHNLNLVTPSHVVPQVLSALLLAAERGLSIPVVWNSSGYDSLEALALLDGVVDVYMPDLKYADEATPRRLSGVPGYPEAAFAAVREMHRQVGDLVLDGDGLAVRGLLVRHLVLPGGLAGTAAVLRFLATEVSRRTYLNLMDQYHPAFRAREHPPLDRRPTSRELDEAFEEARRLGLTRLDAPRRHG